jgi:molecular chaperone DnaK
MGGVSTKMIEANTTIPTSKSQVFSTASDNQPSVQVNVCTGERPMYVNNKHLGTFSLDVPPARRGTPQVEITFSIDSNSILTVKAVDKATGKSNDIRIEGKSSLTKEEIERMKNEAEQNADSDKKEKEKVDKLNQADSMIFQTEKQIEDFSDKLTEENKTELNSKLGNLKEAHKTQNVDTIDNCIKELNDSWQNISSKLYEKSQNESTNDSNPTNETQSPNKDDSENVTDVDFEEVK